jgi:glutamate synthase (NADPH) small chain
MPHKDDFHGRGNGRAKEPSMKEDEQINLHIPEEVESLMKDRGILNEDIQKTIYHAETTGEKFINTDTDHSLASFRPDRVTYWVEYSRVGETHEIHTAYSHRTEMKRKGTP